MTTAIVTGSIADVATKNSTSIAETFISVDVLILIDMSGSMGAKDAPGGKSRFDAAEAELNRLQGELPGKIGVIAFSNSAQFCPNGQPIRFGGGTNMIAAMQMAHLADDTGIKFILISDGEPNERKETLAFAGKFKSKINTIYIGPEDSIYGGRQFLEQLATATGGQALKSNAPGLLKNEVRFLLNG